MLSQGSLLPSFLPGDCFSDMTLSIRLSRVTLTNFHTPWPPTISSVPVTCCVFCSITYHNTPYMCAVCAYLLCVCMSMCTYVSFISCLPPPATEYNLHKDRYFWLLSSPSAEQSPRHTVVAGCTFYYGMTDFRSYLVVCRHVKKQCSFFPLIRSLYFTSYS